MKKPPSYSKTLMFTMDSCSQKIRIYGFFVTPPSRPPRPKPRQNHHQNFRPSDFQGPQKRLKISLLSVSFLIDWGAQNGPHNAPTSSPRGPQDALGARLPLEVGFGIIFGPFWDPSGPRKSCSRCGAVLFLLILRHAPGNPKSPPKWSQNRA